MHQIFHHQIVVFLCEFGIIIPAGLSTCDLTFSVAWSISVVWKLCHVFIRNIESVIFDQLILTFADQTWPAWCLISSLMLFSISEPSYKNITLTVIVPLKPTQVIYDSLKVSPYQIQNAMISVKKKLKGLIFINSSCSILSASLHMESSISNSKSFSWSVGQLLRLF